MKRENGVYIVCYYPYYTVFLPFCGKNEVMDKRYYQKIKLKMQA